MPALRPNGAGRVRSWRSEALATLRWGLGRAVVGASVAAIMLGACGAESGESRSARAPDVVALPDSEVRVRVDAMTMLAGSFSRPAGMPHRVGAVLVLGGSGPQDRDGARVELPGYAPWRDMADALTASGLAVLRLDDRGTAQSTGQFAGATTEDFARDARAALDWLRAQPTVDAQRLAVVGHSEGAVVALLVARAEPSLRALVLLGAPSRNGREIARWQRQSLVSSDFARWPPSERGRVLALAERQADSLAQHEPWLRTWFALDPREVATAVRAPVLLLHGDTDRQVPPEHADELAEVLRRAGATPVEVQHVSDTDHLLLPDADGDPEGYVRLPARRIRPSIIRATTHFLSVHMTSRTR